jgi:UDP-N-acetylglucosamine acyltransferase
MSVKIHPTAIIDPAAKLGVDVVVGPYAVIEANVEIGDRTAIGSHAMVAWGTRMGAGCRIFNSASVGTIPQDLKFAGEETTLEIGDNTMIREFCTINRGTVAAGKTVIGSNCTLLAYCHVAHDCLVGNNVVASNSMTLAGHVTVGNDVTFGGFVGVHQFCRIGDFAFIQSYTRVLRDVITFAMCGGDPAKPRIAGINKVGLERRGYDEARRTKIKRAYKILFRQNLTIEQALPVLSEQFPCDEDIAAILSFIRGSRHGIIRMSEE